jgi:hypothetical protein
MAANWDAVKYCSAGCRRRRLTPIDRQLEDVITELLAARDPASSICPSEAARLVAPDDWRPLMEPARRAARRLARSGAVEITQSGRVVDPGRFSGPIRIRRSGATADA